MTKELHEFSILIDTEFDKQEAPKKNFWSFLFGFLSF